MKAISRCLLSGAAAWLLSASPAFTAQVTNTFQVTANISSACVVEADDLNFGNYDPSSPADVDQSSTIDVYCTAGTAYTLKLNVGTGGGNFTTRTMTGPSSQTLEYNLFTTSGRSIVWGDETGATETVDGTGAGLLTSDSQTVYGRLFKGQDKQPGSYSSTVMVTVEYT